MATTFAERDPRPSGPALLLAAGIAFALALAALGSGLSRGLAPGLRAAFWLAYRLIPMTLLEISRIALGRWPGSTAAPLA